MGALSQASSSSTQDDAFLAQLAALTGLPQLPVGDNLSHALDLLTESLMQQQLPSSSSVTPVQPLTGPVQSYIPSFPSDLSWPQMHQGLYSDLPATSGSAGPSHPPLPPLLPAELSYASTTMNSPASPSDSISAEAEVTSDSERVALEEKRRRNTAASARFRTKKKMRTINLERSVTDLTGRAGELEREVTDLRRENGWLKEIVMLKGTRLAGLNLQQLQDLGAGIRAERQRSQTSRAGQPAGSSAEGEDGEEEARSGGRKLKSPDV
ncbi:hypothetical protein APHAL10511_006483 [Amanita phalloides]|nr:hypothetical protein APHAL10511_006483 [Amanita phalloides]